MDSTSRELLIRVLTENEALEKQAAMWLSLAGALQQIAEDGGVALGVPPIAPGMPGELVKQVFETLGPRLQQVQDAAPTRNGKAIAVAGAIEN
jgi:hypothetical protein